MTSWKRAFLKKADFLIGREQKILKNTRINANQEIPLLGAFINFWRHSLFVLITLLLMQRNTQFSYSLSSANRSDSVSETFILSIHHSYNSYIIFFTEMDCLTIKVIKMVHLKTKNLVRDQAGLYQILLKVRQMLYCQQCHWQVLMWIMKAIKWSTWIKWSNDRRIH